MDIPDVTYGRSGDVAIAYQVVGEGPDHLIFLTFFANLSGTVKDLVAGSGLAFEQRGEHPLKGLPGPTRVYAVLDG